MFNRASKLTALLVAATAAFSVTQSAFAIDRLTSMSGTIDDAIAYNGKYIYKGYKNDEETDIYFCNGSVDKVVEENDDYEIHFTKYGQKYILANENQEDYLLDLTTGKINDADSIEDKKNTLATKLRSTLKKLDRYRNIQTVTLERIENSKFGDVWYKYTADNSNYYGFVNESGRYIDLCNLANLYVVDSNFDIVKLEEYGKANKGLTARAPELSAIEIIAQDNSNFYVKVTIDIEGENSTGPVTVIQKISKTQGAKKDEAFVPSQVTSYIVNNGLFSSSDVNEAADIINGGAGEFFISGGNLYNVKQTTATEIKVTKLLLKKEKLNFQDTSVVSNKVDVQVIEKDSDESHDITAGSTYDIDTNGNVWGINKGKVFKMSNLTSTDLYSCDSSLNRISAYNDSNIILWGNNETYSLVIGGSQKETNLAGSSSNDDNDDNSGSGGGSSSDSNVDNNTNNDVNNNNNNDVNNNNTNVNDNTNGNITNNGSTITNTNGTVTNTNGNITNNGSTITNTNGTVTNTNETTVDLSTTQTGWFKNADETWSFGENGLKKTSWLNDGGNWYFFNESGVMQTGWVADGENWYYTNESGVMQTGWLSVGETWYYLNENGIMQKGWVSDGGNWYYMNASGDMATGWLSADGTWYYLNENGIMLKNVTVDGYKIGADGAWIK